MDMVFQNKLKNREYISKKLYNSITNLDDFDLDKYNEEVLSEQLVKYKNYFDNMYKDIDPNIQLDEEQRRAILTDEDVSLIIAGAGTGKTTTMSSKVKYLVDIKKVKPEKILVMSFTKKATLELERRICYDFDIPAKVTTFHSLGLMYIKEIFGGHSSVLDYNERDKIFYDYFKSNIFPYKDRIRKIIEIFKDVSYYKLFANHFLENYDRFNTFDEYFECYKQDKKRELLVSGNIDTEINNLIDNKLNQEEIITIKGERVKSKGEGIIANFLFSNGIEYEYEKIYNELVDDVYKPDFTLDLYGQKVYIEYFGFSDSDPINNSKYQKIKMNKIDYHKKHHNLFISIDGDLELNIIKKLDNELVKKGFVYKPLTTMQIYDAILDTNKLAQLFRLKDFYYKCVDLLKSNVVRDSYIETVQNYINDLDYEERVLVVEQFKYIRHFYSFYQRQLYSSGEYKFDFSDLIYYANLYILSLGDKDKLNFEYIIIDEYQDISQERYEFTKKIADKNGAKLIAVGDDWQSIYGFNGSKVEYTYNFQKYFENSKLLNISKTYRNSQELIDVSGEFIMKNESQIKKKLHSSKHISDPIVFEYFDDIVEDEFDAMKRLILKIHKDNPEHRILILSRYNSMLKKCLNEVDLIDEVGTRVKYLGYDDIYIDAMTIHKSKGLTYDEVIVIGLNNKVPKDDYSDFWLEDLFKCRVVDEKIAYAEERRVFYVALTRTKNKVYLMTNSDFRKRSGFLDELMDMM